MKHFFWTSVSMLALFLSFLAYGLCFPEDDIALTGKWEGTIYLSGIDIDMEIILVLAEENGKVTGKISDDWGYLDCDIEDPVLEQNVLTFKAMVESSQNDHQMVFRMVVEGGRMAGQWESLGSFGDWSLVKIKEGGEQDRKTFEIEDVVGVWKGPAAYKSNPGSKNVLTLGLEKLDGELAASFSDQFGNEYNRVHVKSFQQNRLVLEIEFTWKNDIYVMDVDAVIKDDSHLRGRFSIEKMGRTGIWTAEKQPDK